MENALFLFEIEIEGRYDQIRLDLIHSVYPDSDSRCQDRWSKGCFAIVTDKHEVLLGQPSGLTQIEFTEFPVIQLPEGHVAKGIKFLFETENGGKVATELLEIPTPNETYGTYEVYHEISCLFTYQQGEDGEMVSKLNSCKVTTKQ